MPGDLTHVTVGFPRVEHVELLEINSTARHCNFKHLPRYWGRGRFSVAHKISILKSYIDSGDISPGSVVLFTDAYDILILQSGGAILEKFLNTEADIIFSAEEVFWPELNRDAIKRQFEQVDGRRRYLNSGGYIGWGWAISTMLNFCYDSLKNDGALVDDQALIQDFYLNEQRAERMKVVLDRDCNFFTCLNVGLENFGIDRGRVVNLETMKSTAVLHANSSKSNMKILQNYWSTVCTRQAGLFPDVRVMRVGKEFVCYNESQGKLGVSYNLDSDSVFFCAEERGQIFAICPRHGLLTFKPGKMVDIGATRVAEWELLSRSPAVTTHFGEDLSDFLPGGKECPKLSPLPLAFLLSPEFDKVIQLLDKFGLQSS